MSKLTLTAPAYGVILTRAIEPGEVTLPGAALLRLANTAELHLTVYIPENRYGEIQVGQTVQVQVDSFPSEVFAASVTRIADRAEFTPRNVQTAEGRATTVFAVRLSVVNVEGKLKPGMPADVRFEE
jgi:HlyD family secretion protein